MDGSALVESGWLGEGISPLLGYLGSMEADCQGRCDMKVTETFGRSLGGTQPSDNGPRRCPHP